MPYAENNAEQKLKSPADNISNYVLVLEAEIDRNMLTAVKVLYEHDRLSGGKSVRKEMERIKKKPECLTCISEI